MRSPGMAEEAHSGVVVSHVSIEKRASLRPIIRGKKPIGKRQSHRWGSLSLDYSRNERCANHRSADARDIVIHSPLASRRSEAKR